MPENLKIGRNLKLLREKAGLSRREIGHYLDVSIQQISKYESGTNRLPVDKLFYLHHLFQSPYEHFFAGLGDPVVTPATPAWEAYLEISKLESESLQEKIRDIVAILAR